MTSLHPHQLWMAAADAGYSSFDEMQEDARLKRAEQLLRERREAEARRHAIEVRLRKAMAVEQDAKARSRRNKERFKNALAILAFIVAILCLWASGAFGAPFAEGQRLERFRSLMPLAEYQRDESVRYYTELDQPRAYQFGIGEMGFHDPNHNIAANPDPFGNANKEFPWNTAGGMDNAKDAYGVKFLRLPGKPVIVWQQNGVWRWRFPKGTAIGEMLIQRCPDGKDRPFEVRIRHRQDREWSVEIYRPFANPAELAEAIRAIRPQWRSEPQLAQSLERLLTPANLRTVSFRDGNANPAVRLEYSRDELPPLPADVVSDLLDRIEFQDVTGAAWRGEDCFAPTASGYSIVPAGYAGHAIGADNESCRKCHNTTGREARSFTQNREWYGRVRGADGIFSFGPFRPTCISHNGGHVPASFYHVPGAIEPSNGRHNKADYQELE